MSGGPTRIDPLLAAINSLLASPTVRFDHACALYWIRERLIASSESQLPSSPS